MLARAAQLSDHALLTQVRHLAQREREATVALIAHLAELDERRLYLAEGYSSLFKYCTDVLHLAEHATYNRIEAARAVRRFPVLLEYLATGWLNLFAVRLLAPHLTPGNHREVLAQARHKSKREIEELVAWLRPQPPVPDAVHKLPTRTPAASTAPLPGGAQDAQRSRRSCGTRSRTATSSRSSTGRWTPCLGTSASRSARPPNDHARIEGSSLRPTFGQIGTRSGTSSEDDVGANGSVACTRVLQHVKTATRSSRQDLCSVAMARATHDRLRVFSPNHPG